MSAAPTRPENMLPLLATGALVLRGFGPRAHLGLVERGGVWSLPRAMLKEHDSHLALARQACEQQLGCALKPADFAGSRLARLGPHKLLTYYWIGCSTRPQAEFTGAGRVRWVPLHAAAACIDYPEERTLVEALAGANTWFNWLRQNSPARRRARAEASVQDARIAADRACFIDPKLARSDTRFASCLDTARAATYLPGAAAQELAHALLAAAEARDLAGADHEQQSLRALVLAEELRTAGDPEGVLLAAELRSANVQGALARVLQVRARRASERRTAEYAQGPFWQQHSWLLATLAGTPFVLSGRSLDSQIMAINLPWYAALWAGLLGACLTPRSLASDRAWIGGLAGLALWLVVLAGLWPAASGPPTVLVGALLLGALAGRL